MVQRTTLIAVTVLSILVVTIVGAVSLSPAYADAVTMTLNVSPNPALPNQPVTFSGQVSPTATSADTITVYVLLNNPACATGDIGFVPLAVGVAPSNLIPLNVPSFTGTANSAGSYSITVSSGFSAGTYGVLARDLSYESLEVSPCDPLTVTPNIPEYPYGLAVLALFLVLGYGLIRRRLVRGQPTYLP